MFNFLFLKRLRDKIFGEDITFNKVLLWSAAILIVALVVAGIHLSRGQEYVTLKDENGQPFYDENGEFITVTAPEPQTPYRTEVNGEPVTSPWGETYTDVYYPKQIMEFPLRDENGEEITDEYGVVQTTQIGVMWWYDPRA